MQLSLKKIIKKGGTFNLLSRPENDKPTQQCRTTHIVAAHRVLSYICNATYNTLSKQQLTTSNGALNASHYRRETTPLFFVIAAALPFANRQNFDTHC